MKTLLLIAGLLPIGYGATAQTELPQLKAPKQSKVDKSVWDVTQNQGFWLHYEGREKMLEAFGKEARLKMWGEQQQTDEMMKLPVGGWLTAKAVGSLREADPVNFLFIIQDSIGREVQRYKPAAALPSVVSLQYGVYSSPLVVPLRQRIGPDYRVFVVNEAKGVRYEFLIRPL